MKNENWLESAGNHRAEIRNLLFLIPEPFHRLWKMELLADHPNARMSLSIYTNARKPFSREGHFQTVGQNNVTFIESKE